MAEIPDKVIKIIKKYIESLSKEIKVERVILFGSYVSGHPDEWSDIDLAIISPDFKLRNYIENLQLLSSLNGREVGWLIEAHPYTSEEYENADPRSFLAEIKRTGIIVHHA